MKKALITGITGQDGSYLAELLLEKGYEVHGLIRRSSTFNTDRIEHLYRDPHDPTAKLFLHYGDLTDGQGINNLVLNIKPEEIYNLGAQSHVRVSFDSPQYTMQVTGVGALNVLDAARQLNKTQQAVEHLPWSTIHKHSQLLLASIIRKMMEFTRQHHEEVEADRCPKVIAPALLYTVSLLLGRYLLRTASKDNNDGTAEQVLQLH